MVLGSACVLSVATRKQIALERHKRRERELKVGESEAFQLRKQKIQKKHEDRAKKRSRYIARKMGFEEKHVKDLQEQFNKLDRDKSGEVDLKEFTILIRWLSKKGGSYKRFGKLNRDQIKELMDYYDHDNSGSIHFDEFLYIVSPRRQSYQMQRDERLQRLQNNQERRRQNTLSARQRYAWNLYDSFNDRLKSFARKWGYDEDNLKKHRRIFDQYDEDGSGEIDLDELMKIGKELNLNLKRHEMREHMKEFDYRRCGKINFMGFLELMSTRRKAALKRQAEKLNRIKIAGMTEHKHQEDVVKRKEIKYKRKEESDLRKWARKLGYGMDEITKLKERFDEQDGDKSGEIDLEELQDMLSTMAAESKERRYRNFLNLTRDLTHNN
jgi:Ca2+-binding EF-hand superfamily protein